MSQPKYVGTFRITYSDGDTKKVHYHSDSETVQDMVARVKELPDVENVEILVDRNVE